MLVMLSLKTGMIKIILPILVLAYVMYGVYVLLVVSSLPKVEEKKDKENGNEVE